MRILLTIIIPTYKRKKSLLRLLASLRPEMKQTYEVIVVEQGENNGEEFIKLVNNSYPFHYFFLPEPSTSMAKNIGVSKARGAYIIFFDDDVIVEKGIFEAVLNDFEINKYDILAGKVLTKGHPIDPDSRNVGKISFLGRFSDDFGSDIPQEVDTVIGCNAAWRKDVFTALGGFDEQFSGNAMREESDLCLRAKKGGYHIMFEPNAVVQHLRETSGGARKTEGRLQWYFHFFSNETYFFLKHRPQWVVPVILLTRAQWAIRCMFGFGREVSIRSFLTPFRGVLDGWGKYKKLDLKAKFSYDKKL